MKSNSCDTCIQGVKHITVMVYQASVYDSAKPRCV